LRKTDRTQFLRLRLLFSFSLWLDLPSILLFLLLHLFFILLLAVEKFLFGFASLQSQLSSSLEVVIIELVVQLKLSEINLGSRRNDVGLVDTTKRNTIQLEGTGDEEKARIQLFQKDDSPGLETTREDDQDGPGRDGFPQASLFVGSLALDFVSDGFFGIMSGALGQNDPSFSLLPVRFRFGRRGRLLFFVGALARRRRGRGGTIAKILELLSFGPLSGEVLEPSDEIAS